MKEIIQKAEIRRWGKAKETVNLQHLSPNRIGKKQKYFDDVSIELNYITNAFWYYFDNLIHFEYSYNKLKQRENLKSLGSLQTMKN